MRHELVVRSHGSTVSVFLNYTFRRYELGNGGQLEGVDFNSSIHDTFGPGTTATLQFAGSSIAVYGVKLDFGAKGIATVDGTPRAFDCVSTDGTVHARQLLFLLGGLDPTVNHKVVVAYDDSSFGPANNRRWLGIDYFEIDTTGVPRYVSPPLCVFPSKAPFAQAVPQRRWQVPHRQARSPPATRPLCFQRQAPRRNRAPTLVSSRAASSEASSCLQSWAS